MKYNLTKDFEGDVSIMKIRVSSKSFDEVQKLPALERIVPKKPNFFFRTLLKAASSPELKKVGFTCEKEGMERLKKDEPCLILMNHSAFIDLEIASTVLYPRPFQIVCTLDGFVGKKWLMRNLGCIPTRKFVTDVNLVKSMNYALKTLKSSVLMYPEASYSFDGTATPLPESLGKCIKFLGVPVVMLRTYGAFLRDPLYNGLRVRNTGVSAKMSYVLSPEEIKAKTADEINAVLKSLFTFDNFRIQQDTGTLITEDFRAEGLDRVLYKCPCCMTEGRTEGRGIHLKCSACGASYTLTEDGYLSFDGIESAGSQPPQHMPAREFDHIPDWYAWERKCVREELESGVYRIDTEVDIIVLKDLKAVYKVGRGRLVHSAEGFRLTGCDGKLDYTQSPLASYSLYSDYFWYEIGDMISIGNDDMLFYCFPVDGFRTVAKARLAAEELYKMAKNKKEKKWISRSHI